ncbi:MAG: aminotransferase DegT [Bacteroidetes bacterium 4572_117]|nr:MAG: aminotransferase DegT [Bacteroidetes bacterium 4572_117]
MENFVDFVRSLYKTDEFIPLHEPRFWGNEKKYVADCIDSTFVSSVGKYVDRFEQMVAEYSGAKYAIATVNGTAALHIALLLAGVKNNDEVITQPLTFIATANAINYCNAKSVFVDVDKENMGLSAEKLIEFLNEFAEMKDDGFCYNKTSKRRIKACVPMHTFGHPVKIDEIKKVCDKYNIVLIEDSAESPGSKYKGKHTGTFGELGILSFNGNKTITTGGGGMILTDNEDLAKLAKHITTTGKIPHKWEYVHDMTAYNYRMPNLNAALGCAQLEQLDDFIDKKRKLFDLYGDFFKNSEIHLFKEPENCFSNYWLQTVILQDRAERDKFLAYTNSKGIMTRPIWQLLNKSEMYSNAQCADLSNSQWFEDRAVNIPSSVIKGL